MKPKLIRILFAFSLIVYSLISVEQVHAQDADPADTYEGNDEKEREPAYSPIEQLDQHHKTQPSSIVKDSAALATKLVIQRPAKPAAENSKPDSKQSSDDSILSFNFLYYIIQKYKLQDIVD